MGALTGKRPENIRNRQKYINTNTNVHIASLEGDLQEVVMMAAWSMKRFLEGQTGDIDIADLAIMKGEYSPKAAKIRAMITILDDVESISVLDEEDNLDPVASQTALDNFITKYGIDVALEKYNTDFNQ